jgi:predicted enzyme related to lactoylglutathione lyase
VNTPAPDEPAVTGPQVDTIRPGDAAYVSLWVPDQDRARQFFAAVLGWPVDGNRMTQRPAADHGFAGGLDPATLMVAYAVDEVDVTVGRVRAAGGTADEPTEERWGRTAMATDPDGLRFSAYQLPPTGRGPRPHGERHGDLTYITLEVSEAERSNAFYHHVFGWEFTPGQTRRGWNVSGTAPMTGLSGGHATPTAVPMYLVDDLPAALVRVAAAGGGADQPEVQPYGTSARCSDDQGTRFWLLEATGQS